MSLRFPLGLLLGVMVFACGPRHLPPASPLDTPANHYTCGLARLEERDWGAAQREFEQALALDPRFPGSHVGQGLVALQQGDFKRARQEIQRAIQQDHRFADAYLALGRLETEEGVHRKDSPETWLKRALAAYRQARKKDPGSAASFYYEGMSYLKAGRLEAARQSFGRVLAANQTPWVGPAMARLESIQQAERASPGSKMGLQIALVPALTRAELCVLLLEELKLAELVRRRQEVRTGPSLGQEDLPQAVDINDAWARPWIEQALALGIPGLELFPDRTFQPDQPVTRAHFALAIQQVLVLITGDPSLVRRYLGEESRFPDVRGDCYAYNAIALTAERGLLAADPVSGRFRPEDPVSGGEALLILRRLQSAVRLEF